MQKMMENWNYLFTSESVTEGHPDKVCDQISDAILDACLKEDPYSRVAVECLITTNKLIIAWEVTTKANIAYVEIAKNVLKEIWYTSEESWFNPDTADIEVLIHIQSPDIAQGVDVWGAGDQWIMFWFATNESESMIPISLEFANNLAFLLSRARKTWAIPYLYPDGKTQVTIEFNEYWEAKRIDTIVISAQHKAGISQEQIRKDIKKHVIDAVHFGIPSNDAKIIINPTGSFVIGGPAGDTWVTGRKIIVDTYWGWWRHGWGAFSWKDPTKVDRSAAYMARFLAKNIVDNWFCKKCEIQLSYAIGVLQPVSIFLEDFWTAWVDKEKIIGYIKEHYDLSPNGIINFLDLRKPIYKQTAAYGHFWPISYPWEKLEHWEIC